MKGLVIVPIENAEHEAYEEAFKKVSNSNIKLAKEINNGTRIQVWNVDAENADALNRHIRKILRWSDGQGIEPYRKPEGVWSRLGKEIVKTVDSI